MTILAKANVAAANVEQVLYTVPASTEALFSVNVCNRNTTSVTVRLSLRSNGEPTTSSAGIYEPDTVLIAGGVLERTGIFLAAGEAITVLASATSVNAIVVGKTDAA